MYIRWLAHVINGMLFFTLILVFRRDLSRSMVPLCYTQVNCEVHFAHDYASLLPMSAIDTLISESTALSYLVKC